MKSKSSKKHPSLYQVLAQKLEERAKKTSHREKIHLNQTIRQLREGSGLSGVELCRRAGDLNPKTLTAVEKGRIKNPSIQTLLSLARGLNLTVADIFRQAEIGMDRNLYLGSQKGAFQVEFPWAGLKIVSFTPFIKDFFCGKFILGAKRKVEDTVLKHSMPFFISSLIGRFQIRIEEQLIDLKEGENLFFNGRLKHTFYNPLHRESVLLLVTAPSFFKGV